MKSPTESLSRLIRRVHGFGQIVYGDDISVAPLLDGKIMDVDVSRTRSRPTFVDHRNGSLLVLTAHLLYLNISKLLEV
jgi:hypothetical protein